MRANRCWLSRSAASTRCRSASATRPGREDPHNRQAARPVVHRPVVENGQVAEDTAGAVDQRDAAVTVDPPGGQTDVVREEGLQALRVVRHLAAQHGLAGRAGHREFEVVEPAAAPPHRERAEMRPVGRQFGHEGVLDGERRGEMAHERGEEALAGLRLDALHDGAERRIFSKRLRGIHSSCLRTHAKFAMPRDAESRAPDGGPARNLHVVPASVETKGRQQCIECGTDSARSWR